MNISVNGDKSTATTFATRFVSSSESERHPDPWGRHVNLPHIAKKRRQAESRAKAFY